VVGINLPIIIGVTGHRDLRKQDIPELKNLVASELLKIKAKYSGSPIVMLNSLAAGADMLCAEVALDLGISLKCPLPMEVSEYVKDFSGEDEERFALLLSKAEEFFTVPYVESRPESMTRSFCYRQAGIYMAQHCHVLLALWDDSPAQPEECGTVLAIDAPLTITPLENEKGALDDILAMTDMYNRDADTIPHGKMSPLVSPDVLAKTNEQARKIHEVYQKADALSLYFQDKYLSVMRWMSVFGVGLVLAFLLYDEFEADLFLPAYGILLVLSASLLVIARKCDYHRRYLQYRVLAETMRTQFFLLAAGIGRNIGEAFTWTQKLESVWIKKALYGLLLGQLSPSKVSEQEIKAAWIDDQLEYHKKASVREIRKYRFNENTALLMLVLSVILFLAVMVLEFLFKEVMTQQIPTDALKNILLMHEGQELIIRGAIKIILGGASAVTLFLANYYGKLSIERKAADHKKMQALYSMAQEKYNEAGIPKDKLLWELAREEIIENGNWYSYCQDNAPGIIL